ncbi:MAG TPA: PIN domain-containing protein [Terracidiphilus sp.]|nr:PIN domain-containing protein [Terracidiphilus sp.]
MTSSVFFDTNILVYALGDPRIGSSDPRPDRAMQLLEHGGLVSIQVLNEYTDAASRKLKLTWPQIAGSLHFVEMLCGRALPLTLELHQTALAIAAHYNLRIYDAMIVASALDARCTTLYTEDLQHGQLIEGLRIENPFLAA